ncbi:MAG: hypothetical protein LBF37_03960, partial [Rickettsiales bacterium]|jgi:hypothetical protein|nr:hypothetical protein [Rickettsiales bacterium]
LRRRTARRVKHRLANIRLHDDKSVKALGQISAAKGWLKWANTYNYQKSVIQYINDALKRQGAVELSA